ncbi:MAG: hypothetical protein IT355_05945 [Gemmatimonadaceae bacterium]|nr:hypothetical protein [Gemmatimonadaceae bacterium]
MNRTSVALAIVFVFGLGLGGCGGGSSDTPITPPPPVLPGVLAVSVRSAPVELRGMRLRVVGAGIGTPRAGSGVRLSVGGRSGDTLRILATGALSSGTFLELPLARTGTAVTIDVLDAAGDQVSGYRVIAPDSVQLNRNGG